MRRLIICALIRSLYPVHPSGLPPHVRPRPWKREKNSLPKRPSLQTNNAEQNQPGEQNQNQGSNQNDSRESRVLVSLSVLPDPHLQTLGPVRHEAEPNVAWSSNADAVVFPIVLTLLTSICISTGFLRARRLVAAPASDTDTPGTLGPETQVSLL